MEIETAFVFQSIEDKLFSGMLIRLVRKVFKVLCVLILFLTANHTNTQLHKLTESHLLSKVIFFGDSFGFVHSTIKLNSGD